MRALGELEQNSQLLHPDWVGALDKFTPALTGHGSLPLFSGCYDGSVRLWLTGLNAQHGTTALPESATLELKGHTQPIKALASFTDPNASDPAALSLGLVSGSLDRSILLWRVQITKRALSGTHAKSSAQEGCSGRQTMRLVGHEGGVEDLDVDPTSLLMCTGSWDHTVKIWDLRDEATDYNADNEEATEEGPKKKKQKKSKSSLIERVSDRPASWTQLTVNRNPFAPTPATKVSSMPFTSVNKVRAW
jgi:ribosome biogenesis protein YTM1